MPSIAGHARCHRSRATGQHTVPSIAGHARCHRSRATHGAIDRAPFTYCACLLISRTQRRFTTPTGPRVESNIGQHDTKRRSEHRFRADFEANSARSDVYSFGCWRNANVPHEIEVVKNIKQKQCKVIQSSVSCRREHVFFRIRK